MASVRDELKRRIDRYADDDVVLAKVTSLLDGVTVPYVAGTSEPVLRKPTEKQKVDGKLNVMWLVEQRDIWLEFNRQWFHYYGHQHPRLKEQLNAFAAMGKEAAVDLASFAPETFSLADITSVDKVLETTSEKLEQLAERIETSHEMGYANLDEAKKKRWATTLRRAIEIQQWCREEIPKNRRLTKKQKEVWKALWPSRYFIYVGRSTLTSDDGSHDFMLLPYHIVMMGMVITIARNHAIDRGIDGVLVQLPPRHGKTEYVTADRALQHRVSPHQACGVVHNKKDLAIDRFCKVREHFDEKEPLGRRALALFPDIVMDRDESREKSKLVLRRLNGDRPCREQEGNLVPYGVHARAQGVTIHELMIDDPVDEKEAHEIGTRERTNNALDKTWMSRLTGKQKFFVYICTSWHPDDFASRLIRKAVQGKINLACYRQACGGPLEEFQPIWPESGMDAAYLRKRYYSLGAGSYACNTGDAPILMSDFTQKQLKDVEVGESVVGFCHGKNKTGRSRLTKSTVLHKGSRISLVCEMETASGQKIRCTPDHKWLHAGEFTRRRRSKKGWYREAYVGMPMAKVYDPLDNELPEDQKEMAAWFAGCFDGEGCVIRQKEGSSRLNIAQCPKTNPEICVRIRNCLTKMGFRWAAVGEGTNINFGCSWEDRRRFLNYCPTSIKAKMRIPKTMWQKHWVSEHDPIVSIRCAGFDTVYSMQTTTGNYIAWGYASKNCIYQNQPDSPANRKLNNLCFYDRRFWDDPLRNDDGRDKVHTPAKWKQFFDSPSTIYYLSVDPSGSGNQHSNLAGITYAAFGSMEEEQPDGTMQVVPKLVFLRFWSMIASQHALTAKMAEIRNVYKLNKVLVETTAGYHATGEDLVINQGFPAGMVIKYPPGTGTKAERFLKYAIHVERGDALFPGEPEKDGLGLDKDLALATDWEPVADQLFRAGSTKDSNLLDCVRQQLSYTSYEIYAGRGEIESEHSEPTAGMDSYQLRKYQDFQTLLNGKKERNSHLPKHATFMGATLN